MTFHKRFYWDQRPTRDSKRTEQKRCALVDIVTEDGEEWIKVSSESISGRFPFSSRISVKYGLYLQCLKSSMNIFSNVPDIARLATQDGIAKLTAAVAMSEQKLMFELAKARWEVADSSESEEGSNIESKPDNSTDDLTNGRMSDRDDELGRMELVRTANDLRRASQTHRIHYVHPRVRFVLPKISDPPPSDLVPLLERIRSTGASVDLGEPESASMHSEELKSTLFPRLLPSPHPPLTDTLNIDCTILLALVSDLSYTASHPIQPNFNAAIRRQIELEIKDHLLPRSLWPAMADKKLVCTDQAAKRMREIVATIGMPNEKERTELLLGEGNSEGRSKEDLLSNLQLYSDYPVPASFKIPIHIMPSPPASRISAAIESGKLPRIAQQIMEELTDINRSVFMYGWLEGYTTVSSNRTVAKAIENTIEKRGLGEKGPEIWLREPARSLLGKEKERRK